MRIPFIGSAPFPGTDIVAPPTHQEREERRKRGLERLNRIRAGKRQRRA